MSEEEPYEDFPPLGDDEVTERLVNLVMLLTRSRFGFTKSEIAKLVPGYSDNPSAMERMFERDKRILEVNNIVLSASTEDEDFRYRIALKTATLPEMSFSKREQEIIRAASLAWENTSQRADAVLLQTKLETIGMNGDFSRKISSFELPVDLETVFAALSQKRILNFHYRRPDQIDTTKRELEIWGIAVRNGSWFIYGKDRIRNAVRVFNLYRVVGGFSISGEAGSYEIQDVDLVELLDPNNRDEGVFIATLHLNSGKGEYWRDLAGLDDTNTDEIEVTVELLKPSEQLPRLAADAPGVVVIGPVEIRDRVASLVWGRS